MKNCLLELKDKILLRKRSIIETINNELKNICQIEHSRHRSFEYLFLTLFQLLLLILFSLKNHLIKFDVEYTNQITLF